MSRYLARTKSQRWGIAADHDEWHKTNFLLFIERKRLMALRCGLASFFIHKNIY